MHEHLPVVPPSTPDPRAAWSDLKHVQVTRVKEDSRTAPKTDSKFPELILDRSWKLICVPTREIEVSDSKRLHSKPKINVVGKTEDDKSYEVVIHESYVQWLFCFGFEQYLDYNPTAPTKEDVLVHGTLEATKRGHARFIRKAASRIRSGCCGGYEDCCRDLARLNGLEIPLERALLMHDVLESDPRIRKLFTQHLVYLGLNALRDYDSCECLALQAKDQADLLQPLQKCHADPLRPLVEAMAPIKTSQGLEIQKISLVRGLLELSGGVVDNRQHALHQEYSISDNFDLCKILVGVTGTNQFGDFDPDEIHAALSKSRVFGNDTVLSTLDVVAWSRHMMRCLPIGFPDRHLVLPSHVLSRLGSGEVDLVAKYIEHAYHRLPSLRKPENNVLLLLIWSSAVHGRALRVLSEWASSGDALNLYQQMIGDFHHPQEQEQLTLTLAALLCHGRLLPYTSDDTTEPIKGGYVADLDALLRGISLSNRRTVFERIAFSFLRVLNTLSDKYEDMVQLLAFALDNNPPFLDPVGGLTDQYVAGRITNRLSQLSTYVEVRCLHLVKTMPQLSMDDDSPSHCADNNLKDYGVEELPGESLQVIPGEGFHGWVMI